MHRILNVSDVFVARMVSCRPDTWNLNTPIPAKVLAHAHVLSIYDASFLDTNTLAQPRIIQVSDSVYNIVDTLTGLGPHCILSHRIRKSASSY